MSEPQQNPGSGVALNGDRLVIEGGWKLVEAQETGLRGKQARYPSWGQEGRSRDPERNWRKQTVATVLPGWPKNHWLFPKQAFLLQALPLLPDPVLILKMIEKP